MFCVLYDIFLKKFVTKISRIFHFHYFEFNEVFCKELFFQSFSIFSFCSIFGNFFQSFSIYRNLVEFLNQTYEKKIIQKKDSLRQNYQKLSKTIENIENRGKQKSKTCHSKESNFFSLQNFKQTVHRE